MAVDKNSPVITPDIPGKSWRKKRIPRKILAIRLQAMGDLVITLPYLQQLKRSLPADTRLDLLTREEVETIPESIELFDHVYSLGGGRNVRKQFIYASLFLLKQIWTRYDAVIDLQNNIVSRFVRKLLLPPAWSSFDRFSAIPAGESNRLTIEAIGLGSCYPDSVFHLKSDQGTTELLKTKGWDGKSSLVILNPAGAFSSRNWAIENYIEFAKLWLKQFPNSQFVISGVSFIAGKASALKEKLNDKLIDLVGFTTPAQGFAIVQKAAFVLSEDSGLMHMAWVSGIPTLALFGSTKSDRATPLGEHTILLHSGDLPCGNCMLEVCKYGDTHCLTRYTPEFVFKNALSLI